jgi:hypothetical protein
MTTRGYTVLGWLSWQVLKRVVKPTVAKNKKVKIDAAATVFAVLAAGVVAARAASSDS